MRALIQPVGMSASTYIDGTESSQHYCTINKEQFTESIDDNHFMWKPPFSREEKHDIFSTWLSKTTLTFFQQAKVKFGYKTRD